MSNLIHNLRKARRSYSAAIHPLSSYPFSMLKILGVIVLFSTFTPVTFGQVQFKIELLSNNVTYQVSMLPSVTWNNGQSNITSTAQIALVVPSGGFSITNVMSLVPGTFWANNGFASAPPEAPNSDYFIFGLTSLGTSAFTYETGIETPIFTFENNGVCTGPIEIVTESDPFLPPNSQNVNITNQIVTVGSGSGANAFIGPYQAGSADCLNDTGCTIEFRLNQLGTGDYLVSLVADTAWNQPLNVTDSLMVTLVAPTGSMTPANIKNLQSGTNFELINNFNAPAESPNFDYFIFELIGGSSVLNYQRNLVVPLFSFDNAGNCEGDSLFLFENHSNPFAMPNSQNVVVGQFIKTGGSVELIEACVNATKQSLAPVITAILATDLTDCNTDNGGITIETETPSSVEYSIDDGLAWQNAKTFSSIVAADYQVKIRYANETCEIAYGQNPVTISSPIPPIIVGVSSIAPNNCGLENGSISINVNSTIFTDYSIDSGETWQAGSTFNNLGVGTYSIAVRNSNLTCEIFGDTISLIHIGASNPVIDTVTFNNVTNCNAFNGGINITASEDNLEYSINNGVSWSLNANFIDLEAGTYNVLVRNLDTNCTEVYQNNPIIINTPNCDNCIARYELELLNDGRFQVSVIPKETWNFPNNYTSTAQVTIVVPTASFYVAELTNLIPGVIFNDNSRINAPIENLNEDYISFGLESIGTLDIPYQADIKIPLFTFRNSGFCMGANVRLMDPEGDPFAFPNSQSINVGQQLSTIGSGQDATMCIVYPGIVPCIPKVVAVDDTVNVFINSFAIIDIISNDTSYLNNPMTTSVYAGSSAMHGIVTLTSSGTLSYTPNPDFTGIDSIQYLLCEDAHPGTCDIGLVTFIVSGGNQIFAEDDDFSTQINTSLNANVSINDNDLNNNQLSYEISIPSSNGLVNLNPDGTFIYTPNIGFFGYDEFLYQVCDNGFPTICEFATVRITILASGQLTAINDSFFGTVNNLISGNVISNDFNPSGGILNINLLPGSDVANGILTLNADGTFDYIPNLGFIGTDEFQYIVCNNLIQQECDTASVQFIIMPVIMAINDTFNLNVGTVLNDILIDNDMIPNGVNYTISLVSNPNSGFVNINTNGSFSYTPNPGFSGQDTFQYQICNDSPTPICDIATVILFINEPLQATDDHYNGNSPISDNILDNDQIPNGTNINISIIEPTENGNFNINPDGSFEYTPNNGFLGSDTLQYEICSVSTPIMCDTATVIFDIGNLLATDDSFQVLMGSSLSATVIPNDLITVGNNYQTTILQENINGSLILQGNGDFFYIPDTDFTGTNNFQYQLCETIAPFTCDTANVFIEVLPIIEAFNDTIEVNINTEINESVIPNDNIPQGFGYTTTLLSDVSQGTLTLNINGTFNYQPFYNYLGTDSFEYEICTSNSPQSCDIATVFLEIKGIFLAIDDNEVIDMNETITGNVTDNDIFPDTTNVTISELPNSGPNNGTLILNDNGTYTYIPDNGFSGNDSFGYIICDSNMPPLCDTGLVNITVIAPLILTAVDDYYFTNINVAISNNVLPNDFNPDNADLTVAVIPTTGPNFGNLILNTDGSFIYTPNFGFVGNDQFNYQVCDNQMPQYCNEATVFITITSNGLQKPTLNCITQFCTNETITLNINTIYNGQSIGFEWINGNNEVIGTGQVLELNPNAATAISPYQVQVTVDGQTTEMSDPCTVAILPIPTAAPAYSYAMGEDCAPENLALSANAAGNNLTYIWTSNYGFYSQQESPLLLNADSSNNGFYELKVTDENGCETSANFEINNIIDFIPEPIIFTTGPTCMGQEIELNTQLYQGFDVDYAWMKNNTLMIGQSSFQLVLSEVDMNDTGMYRVIVKVDDCIHQSDLFEVDILETPTLQPDFALSQICEGGELQLNTNSTNAGTIDFHEWTGPSGFYSTAENPLIINALATANGTYSVKITAENGCQNEESFTINGIIPVPETPQIFGNGTICEEGTAILTIQNPTVGTAVEYEWINGIGDIVAITTATELSLSANSPQMISPFTVRVTADGCASNLADPIEILVENPPTPTLLVNTDFLCEGDNLSLTTEPYSGQNISYQWHFNNGTNIVPLGYSSTANFFINNVTGTNAGQYFVIVEVDGCATDTSNVQQINVFGTTNPPIPTNDTDASNPACEGSNVQLNLSPIPGATYEWYGPQGFNATMPNPILQNVTAAQSGEYFVIVNFNGCSIATPATTVSIVETPNEIAFGGSDLNICGDNIVTLNAQNSPAVTGTWSQSQFQTQSGILIENPNEETTQISGLAPGNYTFVWSLSNNICDNFSSDEIAVTVSEAPDYEALILGNNEDQSLCDENIVSLQASAPPAGISGNWSAPIGAVIANAASPQTTVEGLTFGENIFIWSVSSGACEDFSQDTLFLFNESLEAVNDFFGAFPNDTMFNVNLTENDIIEDVTNWTFILMLPPTKGAVIDEGNGLVSYIAYPGAFGEDEFTYMICSEACPNVCDMATVQILIANNDDEIYVPNTITPNDDGINDVFLIPAIYQYPGSTMAIFNRYGAKVYHSDDYQNDWKGTYQNDPLPVGTYFYCLQVNNMEQTVLQGFITIRR